MPNNASKIAALRSALDSGVMSVNVDGQVVTFRSAAEISKRIRELEAEDANFGRRRPVASSINLSGF